MGDIKVDGRRERTKRTRAAIVAALTELLDEGRIEPTAADIAARAKVAVRSVAQHFATREELLVAVAEHHEARHHSHAAIDPSLPLDERLARFTTHRARALEASLKMRAAAAVVSARSPSVAQTLGRMAAKRRAETAAIFAREIAASRDPRATERTLALITSGRAWDAMRHDLALGESAARAHLETMLRAALPRSS